jgi:3-methyladenine DNA glycosylase AlkD
MEKAVNLEEILFSHQDLKYRDFITGLIPNIDKETIIGIRTPEIRKISKEFSKQPEVTDFMENLPHRYFEENNIHGFIISSTKDFDNAIDALNKFLPYVDNWATCDGINPVCFKNHPAELLPYIKIWLSSEKTYTIRFAIGMLMRYFLDEDFKPEYLELVSGAQSEEYYVNMMIAWYFATALAKQYESTVAYIEEKRLSKWVHNKTIQKSIESYRITDEEKEYLKTLKIR